MYAMELAGVIKAKVKLILAGYGYKWVLQFYSALLNKKKTVREAPVTSPFYLIL